MLEGMSGFITELDAKELPYEEDGSLRPDRIDAIPFARTLLQSAGKTVDELALAA